MLTYNVEHNLCRYYRKQRCIRYFPTGNSIKYQHREMSNNCKKNKYNKSKTQKNILGNY